ncbi:GNAT family N-acetyltransferase [Pseudomonas nabeulensis]|uniref:GNAT family N-acetyltransferase n=1 Tax=Pseudomonas nabeulensis TaxID=2293833 RepID=A0A4Z0B439_9PSED|nr:GNAT family N-acetyltransferase [Pseudomonas nabeulensis]TFY93470.1 GNAT family N-acetyltransferase [Pseudomonas nabeulensis]
MTIEIITFEKFEDIPTDEYVQLISNVDTPAFYDPRFLKAAEHFPLLPPLRIIYFMAYLNGQPSAFMPCYLQTAQQIDPFGLLANTASISFSEQGTGLFSHVMHCYDTKIIATNDKKEHTGKLLNAQHKIACEWEAEYFGFLNTCDTSLITAAQASGMQTRFMLDRFYLDIVKKNNFELLVEELPADGRREMKRQLRRFSESNAKIIIEAPPLTTLPELVTLCQRTTARHGTPHYFPEKPLFDFVTCCGDMVRTFTVRQDDQLIAGFICFLEEATLHMWCAGMTYDDVKFSPFTILVAEAYQYAFAHKITRVEMGRLNTKIKTRLGFSPLPLFSIIGNPKEEFKL